MMTMSTQSKTVRQSMLQRLWRSADAIRWATGIAVAVAAIGAVVMAIACAPASIRANNNLCLQQVANDEHTTLEAFFQNPADQDALVLAITICSR